MSYAKGIRSGPLGLVALHRRKARYAHARLAYPFFPLKVGLWRVYTSLVVLAKSQDTLNGEI